MKKQFKETLNNITEEKQVKEFLDFCKETQKGPVDNFDYKIIDIQDIPAILKTYAKNAGYINININSSNYTNASYNPIIFWLFDCGEHVNIYDLANLKHSIAEYAWLTEDEKEEIIMKFNPKNIKEKCFEMLDKLNENEISEYDMYQICKPLSNDELFCSTAFKHPPKYITEYKELLKFLKNEDTHDPVHSAICFMNNNAHRNIDIFEDKYWVYQDGVNWETWIASQDSLIGYIEAGLDCCEKDTLIKIYKILKTLIQEEY